MQLAAEEKRRNLTEKESPRAASRDMRTRSSFSGGSGASASTTADATTVSDRKDVDDCNAVKEDWEEEFKKFPDHIKFLNKLKNAQANANESQKRVQICWRGHRTSIFPKAAKMTKKDFIHRLITALKNIRVVSSEEKNVSFIQTTSALCMQVSINIYF